MRHLNIPNTPQDEEYILTSSPEQEERERQSQILQSLAAAVYTCDRNGVIKFYNKAAADLWGRQPEIGKDLWCGSWKIYEPDGVTHLPLDTCPMAITLKEGRSVRGKEIIVERPDGQRRNVMPYPDPIFDSSGVLVEAVNLLVDITDLKQKERALRENEEKYRQLSADLQVALKSEEEFISIASHELKTPITIINAFLQILIEMHPEQTDKNTNYMLKRSKAQVDQLMGLTRNLLDAAKIKNGKLDLNFEDVFINNIVDDVINDISSTITSHTIIKNGESKSNVRCDKSHIEQVMSNLLINAVKYSNNADKIIVTIEENEKNIQVSIQDFGIGIAEENIPKVFDRFFRAHGTGDGILSSLGLGLYISADIIKCHNGKIWVDSKIGEGSTFHFSLQKQNAIN